MAISRHANTGAYAFPCGEQLRGFCRNVLDGSVGSTGEYYTSVIIERMIRDGHKVGEKLVSSHGHRRKYLSFLMLAVVVLQTEDTLLLLAVFETMVGRHSCLRYEYHYTAVTMAPTQSTNV